MAAQNRCPILVTFMLIPYDDHFSHMTALTPCEPKSAQAGYSGTERMHAEIASGFVSPRSRGAEAALRKSGLDLVGDLPWGAHFCQFYSTGDDLLDILAPYFAAGLAANEFCMWIVSEPLGVDAAEAGLRKIVPELDAHLAAGQIKILGFDQWYTRGGAFDAERVTQGWQDKLDDALRRGFDGLRLTGNTSWLTKDDWADFRSYEEHVGRILKSKRILALCGYCLDKCDAAEILDVVARHEFALIRRGGEWEIIKSLDYHRTQQELQESEERFRLLIEGAPDTAAFMLDAEGRIANWNDSAERIGGWAAAEIVGRHVSILYPAERREHLQRTLELAATQGVFKDQGERVRKNGSLFLADVLITPLRDETGRLRGYAKMLRDVSERRRVEQESIASQARLRATVEGAVDAIITIDQSGVMLSLNSAALRLFGYELGDSIGRNVKMLLPEPFRSGHDGYLADYLRTGEATIIGTGREVVGQRKDGSTVPLELTISEASYDGNRLLIAYLRDLTERRKTETHMQKLRADRLDLMAQMAAGVAHEINQPLSAIATYLSTARRLLRRQPGESAETVEGILDSAVAQVMRAAQIIGHLRGFVASAEPDKTLQSLHELIRHACSVTDGNAKNSNVEVTLDLAAACDSVIIDKVQIRQVLVNLKRNAIEAMQGSAKRELVISTRLVEGGMIRTDIADTGAGLSDDMSLLFEPFITTKTHGLGVGLSVSHSIVEAHYGNLWAESNPGGGAILSFTLPLADEHISDS